jgi:cysteinyl-tRNA synthetase
MKEEDITLVDIINDEIQNHNQLYILLNHRIKAKKEKDYELADKIRKEIQEAGIEIKDNKDKIILSIKWKSIETQVWPYVSDGTPYGKL